jgi:hypothetical protein
MHSRDQILKTDKVGRVRTPRERREELLDEFERSGVAATKFAQMVGIKYQTFASWQQKRRMQADSGRGMKPGKKAQAAGGMALCLVEAVAEPAVCPGSAASQDGMLRVRLACGAHLDVTDEKGVLLAARLLGALSSMGSGARSC